VPGYIEVQDAAAIVRDDKEAIQHAKGQRGLRSPEKPLTTGQG
jgi:hypothetical protein